MVEVKAAVAIDGLTDEEACTIFREFGYEPESATRLYGGYASSNFKVVGRHKVTDEGSVSRLLKINHYSISMEDLEHQICVLQHLKTTGFPTNYPHAAVDGRMLVEAGVRRTMLLDFVPGAIPGNTLIAKCEAGASSIMTEVGGVLAQLHATTWPSEPKLRDVRSGYPVCNMGDLLKGEDLASLRADEKFTDHPLLLYIHERTAWLRELFDRDVPWGLIHGDGFLDNTLFADRDGEDGVCELLALIDWEDSCVGPFALDLAVAASACCFTGSNDLLSDRLEPLLRAYLQRRPLSKVEAASLPDFMAAGAAACSFYRFGEFNIRNPGSDAAAKDSWTLHFERAKLLHVGCTARSVVETTLRRVQESIL